MLSRFAEIAGSRVCFRPPHPVLNPDPVAEAVAAECAEALDLVVDPEGTVIPLPYPAPVGTAGLRRMLHRWRVLVRGKGRG